jgi:hypothetical protein
VQVFSEEKAEFDKILLEIGDLRGILFAFFSVFAFIYSDEL